MTFVLCQQRRPTVHEKPKMQSRQSNDETAAPLENRASLRRKGGLALMWRERRAGASGGGADGKAAGPFT